MQIPAQINPLLPAEQIEALLDHYSQLLRAMQANDDRLAQNEIEWLRREVEPRAMVNQTSPLTQIDSDLEDIGLVAIQRDRWPAGARRLLLDRLRQVYEHP